MEAEKQLIEDIRDFTHKVKRHERNEGARPDIYDFIATIENKYRIEYKIQEVERSLKSWEKKMAKLYKDYKAKLIKNYE